MLFFEQKCSFLNKMVQKRAFLKAILREKAAVSYLEKEDTMGERIGRIRRIRTDFLTPNARILSKKIKKNPFESARSAQSVLP
jgi:hypothetical protein